MIRILSVSSSRADVNILMPIWRALAKQPEVDLHLLLTGMHRAAGAPGVDDVPEAATVHRGGTDLGGATGGEAAAAMASIAAASGKTIAATQPAAMLVVGDRLDILPAATASLPFNVPLVHLHGGEVTEGAVDDRIRHAISKLAHWHCASTEGAKARLIAMGESEERITVTGAPGLDSLLAAPVLAREDFLDRVGLPAECDFRLVAVHPETMATDPLAPVTAVLAALAARPAPTLITAPNSDPGGAEARRQIEAFCNEYPWARFHDTLGTALYPSALRHTDIMLGNSSSAIIEAGVFGLPAINVGDRQKGRERGANVTDVPNETAVIITALDRLCQSGERAPATSPYGDGAAGPRVAAVLRNMPERDGVRLKPGINAKVGHA